MPPTIAQRRPFATLSVRAAAFAALALAAPAAPARADDLFSVAGVTVDIEAESAEAARERAVAVARTRALDLMLRKLTRAIAHHRLPRPAPEAVARLARSYEVTRERRSARRYIGEFTVRFDGDGIRETLRRAGVPHAETRSPPLLVLPVLVQGGEAALWEAPNPWSDAWRALGWRGRLTVLPLPSGDIDDAVVLSAADALAGDGARLDAMAARYGAAGALVAIARPGAGGRSLAVETRPRRAPLDAAFRRTIVPPPGEDLYLAAAAAVAGEIDRRWLAENLIDLGPLASMDVTARFDGLAGWLSLRRRLAALTRIERVDIHSLGASEAALVLHYAGTGERLRAALAARGLDLVPGDGREPRLVDRAPSAVRSDAPVPVAPAVPAAEPVAAPPPDDLFFE